MRRRLASRVPYTRKWMTPLRKNEPIRSWEAGDQVQGFASADQEGAAPGQARQGASWTSSCVDATGSIAGQGLVRQPGAARRLRAAPVRRLPRLGQALSRPASAQRRHCREATDEDRRYGFDEAQLIPSTRTTSTSSGRDSSASSRPRSSAPILRRLAVETLAVHATALREHPAAKSMHHAYRGGLLEHVVVDGRAGASAICGHYRELDRDLVLLGVLFHDLGKLIELGAMPVNDYTLAGPAGRSRGHRPRPPARALRRHPRLPRRPRSSSSSTWCSRTRASSSSPRRSSR